MERLANLENAIQVGYKQVYNGLWTAQFTLPADDPKNKHCQQFNYVEIYDGGQRVELFRIIKSRLTRGQQGFREYKCEHVITTLLDDVLFKFHQIGNIGVFTEDVINDILARQTVTRWRLGTCEFRHQFLYKWESDNLLAALFSIPRPFAEEWHFTYDTTSYPWTINLVKAETQIGCELRRRKNMQGVTKEEDSKNLVTRLYPLGYGEGDNQLTIRDVNNGVPYLDADTISKWGLKSAIWTDRRLEDPASMKATAETILEQLKNPYISYTVESIDLFKRTKQDFDRFIEGKMVRVIDRQDNIDIDTRIMEIDKPDVTKADVQVVIANKDRNVAGSIAALQDRARINETYAQGAETQIPMTFIDNAEPDFPAVFEFFLPASMVNINEARLRIQLLPFRAFSRAIQGGGGTTQTSTSGGGTTASTTNGGGVTPSTTWGGWAVETTTWHGQQSPTTSTESVRTPTKSTSGSIFRSTTPDNTGAQWSLMQAPWPALTTSDGTPSHNHGLFPHRHDHAHTIDVAGHSHTVTIQGHGHNVTIPGHSHNVTIPGHDHFVTIPAHQHNVTIAAHQHNITIPNHTHNIEFGIFTGTRADSVSIRVDDTTVPITGGLDNIDIIPFLRRDSSGRIVRNAWHRLEIVPNRLTRISASIFLTIFTNSRGGENL